MSLPWQPLLTTLRSGQPEVTLHGLLSVVSGKQTLIAVGETQAPLWSRSLLKPWQLLVALPTLEKAYPHLRPEQLALMMASHNGEARHIELLQELLALGGLDESQLQCPACAPMAQAEAGQAVSVLYHPCSGKHLGQLLALKAQGHPLDTYLSANSPLYQALTHWMCQHFHGEIPALSPTIDGCQMANMALTADLLARLYHQLAVDETDSTLLKLQTAMQAAPEVLGGQGRLDTRLIQRTWTEAHGPVIYAKEGADGLLGVGIAANTAYPEGLGICIKLASGYNSEHLEQVILAVLEQLGLLADPLPALSAPLTRQAHFKISQPAEVLS